MGRFSETNWTDGGMNGHDQESSSALTAVEKTRTHSIDKGKNVQVVEQKTETNPKDVEISAASTHLPAGTSHGAIVAVESTIQKDQPKPLSTTNVENINQEKIESDVQNESVPNLEPKDDGDESDGSWAAWE